jgi:alkylhydroperoxidase/carboxymuconolactone decarboxylase family protein YurZ
MTKTNPFEVFQKEAPEVAKGFDSLIQSLVQTKGLDGKTKQLIYIGIKATLGDVDAIKYHVPMAKQLGATREEIKDTILITLTVCGLKGVVSCLPLGAPQIIPCYILLQNKQAHALPIILPNNSIQKLLKSQRRSKVSSTDNFDYNCATLI